MWGIRGILLFILLASAQVWAQNNSQTFINAAYDLRDASFSVFDQDIRPALMKGYASYKEAYGDEFGEMLLATYDKVAPATAALFNNTKDFWYHQNPKFFDSLARLPAPVKIAYENIYILVWKNLIKVTDLQSTGVNAFSVGAQSFSYASKMMDGTLKPDPVQQKRLEKLLDQLRAASPDAQMAKCFRVYAVPVVDVSSVNTGCHIFITKDFYSMLDDAQLRAVLAHEMSHGINGDSIKKFGLMTKAAVAHLGHASADELLWILTNEETEYFDESMSKGLLQMTMEKINMEVQKEELNADINGVILLNKAGFSGNDMLSALYTLDYVKPGQEDIHEKSDPSDDHPPLYVRLQAVRKNMRF